MHGGTSTYRLDLTIGAQPRCYLKLTEAAGFVTSVAFSIAAQNGTVTIWNANSDTTPVNGPILAAVPPGATNYPVTVKTVSLSSTVSTATATVTNRPVVTLTSDGPPSQYRAGGFDCLDAYSDPNPGCWEVLNMDQWLPAWLQQVKISRYPSILLPCLGTQLIQQTPPCSNNFESDATCKKGSEPWTVTFLREASGPGPDCLNLGGECYWNFNAVTSDPLLTARHKYGSLSIVCKYHTSISFDFTA